MNFIDNKITLTREQLITIIEDAFVDGWETQDDDWSSAHAYLEHHKMYNDSCETTTALDNIRSGGE